MRIHAFRRQHAFDVDLTPRGSLTLQLVRFYLNDSKHAVADVSDPAHIDTLLNIPEAYREYDESNLAIPATGDAESIRLKAEAEASRAEELRKATQRQQIADAQEAERKRALAEGSLIGSSTQPTTISLTGNTTVPLGEVVAAAHRASALSIAEWNELESDEREALISKQIDVMEREAEDAEAAEMERIRLQAQKDEEAAAEAEAEKKRLAEAAAAEAEAKKFVLLPAEGDPIDLKTYDDTKLREFAKTFQVALPPKVKGDALRQIIVDALAPPASEEQAASELNKQLGDEAAGDAPKA